MSISRRTFMTRAALLAAANPAIQQAFSAEQEVMERKATDLPLFVSTWPFGKPANEAALKVFQNGGSLLDAVEQGIVLVETSGNSSVGLAGIPNAEGIVQLDACIMAGPDHRAGSVAALEAIAHPISVARRVMEKTPHVMLVGEGAQQFALKQGFALVESAKKKKAEKPADKSNPKKEQNHDTIALLALGADGNIYGGCSTSGWGGKLPGRVGDSPIIGSGLYVDNEVGAAGATGLGENVMRYCASFMVVEYMRQGMSPEEACVATIKRIASKDPRGLNLSINFVALDKQGRYGAAGTGGGFSYSVTTGKKSGVLQSAALSNLQTGPVGGNRF